MDSSELFISLLVLQVFFSNLSAFQAAPECSSYLFREYIGAEGKNVTFSDVPINSKVDFHFILSFAIDYTNSSSPSPTNGDFHVYWDSENLSPSQVAYIKTTHPNVKVAMSLAGDSINGQFVYFTPVSIDSWVRNAIYSITKIVKDYNLDGIDIDYEHFNADPEIFAECIGRLLFYLKQNNIISFTSIAPFPGVQEHYFPLWRKYGHLVDFVNFQFYAYNKGTTISQFLQYFETQVSNYEGGKLLVSFGTDDSGGLSPQNGFFNASNIHQVPGEISQSYQLAMRKFSPNQA